MTTVHKGYVCYRAQETLSLNGKLDDPAWRAVPWTDPFTDIEGDIRPKPRHQTRAKMLWDDEYFYVGADLIEPDVWATLTERDSVIFHDNDFEIFIDPDGDNHQYYEIEINALNTVWDLRLVKPYRDGGPALNEWNIDGLKTAVHVDGTINRPGDRDRGWSMEMAFPWKVLAEYANRPTPPKDGDQWRINFSRVEWKTNVVNGKYVKAPGMKEDNWVWSPQGVVDMHWPEMWGYVQFSTGKPGTAKFKPDPTLPARQSLMKIYYAQQELKKRKNWWASSYNQLFPPQPSLIDPLRSRVKIHFTRNGWIASMDVKVPGGKTKRLNIREDSRLWLDP
jgi:hypothetical protein